MEKEVLTKKKLLVIGSLFANSSLQLVTRKAREDVKKITELVSNGTFDAGGSRLHVKGTDD